jgi:hypothetical protein
MFMFPVVSHWHASPAAVETGHSVVGRQFIITRHWASYQLRTQPVPTTALKESYAENADLRDALGIAVSALQAGSAEASNGDQPTLDVGSLEAAILDANRPRRAFRRLGRPQLETLLPSRGDSAAGEPE